MITIYTSTDVGEVAALLGGKANWISFDEVSNQDQYILFLNGQKINTGEFSARAGQEVQNRIGLTFNPYSVISCSNDKVGRTIIGNLLKEKLYVASLNGHGLENHFAPKPNEIIKDKYHFQQQK